jgi:hypothetical protein
MVQYIKKLITTIATEELMTLVLADLCLEWCNRQLDV